MITLTTVQVYRGVEQGWAELEGQKFSRDEIAIQLNVSRTTLWNYEKQIIRPAIISDFLQYVREHPRKLDLYCVWILSQAANHMNVEGSYPGAAAVMKQHRRCYTRNAYDHFVQTHITRKTNHANQNRSA